jgi:hypothetical protein
LFHKLGGIFSDSILEEVVVEDSDEELLGELRRDFVAALCQFL